MQKELYTTPEMELTYFEAEDIVTASPELEEDEQLSINLKF